jgi:large subunit ribosomal protein L29
MSVEEINGKSKEELITLLDELTSEQLKLKIKKAVGQLNAPHRLRLVRRNIARVKTLLRLHEISDIKIEGEVA